MSNRSVYYELFLKGDVKTQLIQTESAALSLDSTMSKLQSTVSSLGLALGLHQAIDIGKEWLQGAADYEQANLRIRNVSDTIGEGIKNQLFIKDEVDRFKIDLQRATEGYGEFLTMIRGSHLAGAEVRKLHDEVLMIGKITGLGDMQMDASVRNLGKLLEQGTLESKHLRPLTYQLSGLQPYIADELGMTRQELEKAMSSGKLTKAAIDSKVLIDAIAKYAHDLESKLPESLRSIQSQLNSAGNDWLEFKNSIGGGNDMRGLVSDFAEFTHYLKENSGEIMHIASTLGTVLKYYLEWRLAIFAMQAPFGLYSFFVSQSTRLTEVTSLYGGVVDKLSRSFYIAQEAATGLSVANANLSRSVNFENLEFNALNASATASSDAMMSLTEIEANFAASLTSSAEAIAAQEASLMASTLQMDLFTSAQAAGSVGIQEFGVGLELETTQLHLFGEAYSAASAQASLFTETELALTNTVIAQIDAVALNSAAWAEATLKLQADARAAGMAWFYANGSMTRTAAQAASAMSISGTTAGAAFVTGAEEAAIAWEAAAATMQESAVVGTMSFQQMAAMNAKANPFLNGGFASGLKGVGSALIQGAIGVFIVGMAADVAAKMFNIPTKSKISGDEMSTLDWLDPRLKQSKNIGNQLFLEKYLQEEIDLYRTNDNKTGIVPSTNKILSSKDLLNPTKKAYERDFYPEGHELFDAITRTGKNFNKDLYESFNLKNQFGGVDSLKQTNSYLNSVLKGKGFNPYDLSYPVENGGENDKKTDKPIDVKSLLGKIGKASQVKGNSVTNINLDIKELNGLKNCTFPIKSLEDYDKIKEVIGNEVVKILTDAVNDSQHVSNKR